MLHPTSKLLVTPTSLTLSSLSLECFAQERLELVYYEQIKFTMQHTHSFINPKYFLTVVVSRSRRLCRSYAQVGCILGNYLQ